MSTVTIWAVIDGRADASGDEVNVKVEASSTPGGDYGTLKVTRAWDVVNNRPIAGAYEIKFFKKDLQTSPFKKRPAVQVTLERLGSGDPRKATPMRDNAIVRKVTNVGAQVITTNNRGQVANRVFSILVTGE